METAALAISVVALLASIGAVIYTRMAGLAQRDLTRIERERRHEELHRKGEADLRAEVRRGEKQAQRRLVVTNKGGGPARALEVEIAADPPDGRLPRFMQDFPPELDADAEAAVTAHLTMGLASNLAVTLRWRDACGPHEKVVPLSLL